MVRKISHIEEIDRYVGDRIFKLRTMLGMTREMLASHISVTHQQLQKYEKGINRISAGRLFMIAGFLNVPVSYFFEEAGNPINDIPADLPNQRQCMEVSKNFMRIKNEDHQDAINFLVRKLAGAETISESSEKKDKMI